MRTKSGANSVRERPQRLLDQPLAATVVDRHVLLPSGEIAHVLQGDHADPMTDAHADLRAPAAELRLLGEAEQLRGGDTRGVPHRPDQLLASHGLQQVAHRLRLEGLERVLVVGGGEDHRRRLVEGAQVAGRLDAVHARHADVEQHHVGREALAERDRLVAVRRLADDRDLAQVLEQVAQPLASRRLVVDDQQAYAVGLGSGVHHGRAAFSVGTARAVTTARLRRPPSRGPRGSAASPYRARRRP
jgi:hypothetical protein